MSAVRHVSGPLRPFGVIQQRIIDGIARELTYREIGRELAALSGRKKPVSPLTVRAHVVSMARSISGLEALSQRDRLYVWWRENSR